MRGAAAVLAVAFLFALPLGADDARPRFYRWTDAEGVVHYTNDLSLVPEPYRAGAALPRTRTPAPAPAAPETPGVAAGAPAAAAVTTPLLGLEEIAPGDGPEVVRLKRAIALDRERIKVLLSQPDVDGPKLAADPALAEIAARLARQQAELEALRHESVP